MELIIAAEKLISWRRGLIATPVCREPAWALDAIEVDAIDGFLRTFAAELASPAIGLSSESV
jgi:4-hydroxy-tetrahydrodipicolinate synthase